MGSVKIVKLGVCISDKYCNNDIWTYEISGSDHTEIRWIKKNDGGLYFEMQ